MTHWPSLLIIICTTFLSAVMEVYWPAQVVIILRQQQQIFRELSALLPDITSKKATDWKLLSEKNNSCSLKLKMFIWIWAQ